MEQIKSCLNCRFNIICPEYNALKMGDCEAYNYIWQPDYQTLEHDLLVTTETAKINQDKVIQLTEELHQSKEALRLACERLIFLFSACPGEVFSNVDNKIECFDACDLKKDRPLSCWVEHFTAQAKSNQKENEDVIKRD